MKKFFIIAVMAVTALSANAQYTPAKGDISLGVKFNPFASANSNGSATFESTEKYAISGRYMLTDKIGIRATVGFNYDYNDGDMSVGYDAASNSYYTYNGYAKKTNFGLSVGAERHFAANDRIDLYTGAQLGVGFQWSNGSTGDPLVDVSWKGNADKPSISQYGDYYVLSANSQTADYTSLKAGVFTGINFYVYKKLYLGAELAFTFENKWYHDLELTQGFATYETELTGHSTNFGFKVDPTFHLGWTF